MRRLVVAAAISFAAGAAQAATLMENNFDLERPGVSSRNYHEFSNLTVVQGSVNLVHSGDDDGAGAIECVGQKGGCVDLEGTDIGSGALRTASFAFEPGNRYTFTYAMSGNQRQFDRDDWLASMVFEAATDAVIYRNSAAGQKAYGISSFSLLGDKGPQDWFDTYFIAFEPLQSGMFYAQILTGGQNNQGPILDNVSVTSTAIQAGPIPEPSTWTMLLIGFGLAGHAVRSRRIGRAAARA